MDKITVVCHKDHDKGCGCYIWKCLLCEVERLSKREWVGLTDEEFEQAVDGLEDLRDCWIQIEAKLKEKNT